jgi:hypothetical protein
MLNEGTGLLCRRDVLPQGADRHRMTRMATGGAGTNHGNIQASGGTDERYEHWKGGREQVDVA